MEEFFFSCEERRLISEALDCLGELSYGVRDYDKVCKIEKLMEKFNI